MAEVIRDFATRQYRVRIEAVGDDDLDLSWDETGEVARKLQCGLLENFCARVVVVHVRCGVIGEAFLGGCIYEQPADFMDHKAVGRQNRALARRGETGRVGSYFVDMIHEAIAEARDNMQALNRVYVRAAA